MTAAPVPVWAGRVDETATLRLERPREWRDHLRTLRGRDVELVVRVRRPRRSNPQNRYYWAVVVGVLAEHTGYSAEEMHDALKLKFLRLEDSDHPIPTVRSTAGMPTDEFERYMEQVRQWAAADLGCYIPLPNEVDS